MLKEITFGFWPRAETISVDGFNIEPLEEIEQIIKSIQDDSWVKQGWFFYSPEPHPDAQFWPSRIFHLENTHIIKSHSETTREHLEFLVWVMGFFCGMRFTIEKFGYLYAVPVQEGKLTDFVLSGKNRYATILMTAEKFWRERNENPKVIKLVKGVIHSLYLSGFPSNLSYERFIYKYMALDGCRRLFEEMNPQKKLGHRKIETMLTFLGIKIPDFIQNINLARDETFHEALFFEEPLGFTIYGGKEGDHLRRLEMLFLGHLINRVLVAILVGKENEYVQSPYNTRDRHGLKIEIQ